MDPGARARFRANGKCVVPSSPNTMIWKSSTFDGRRHRPTCRYWQHDMCTRCGRIIIDLDESLDVCTGNGVFVAESLHCARATDADQQLRFLRHYLAAQELNLSRAQAEERMFAKLNNPGFLADILPLLTPTEADRVAGETLKAAFASALTGLVEQLPGNPWARTNEMIERFDLDL